MNHIDRLLDERSELVLKVSRLSTFMHGEQFASMDVIDRELMVTQRYVMHQYIDLLTTRIDRATHHAATRP